MLRAARGDPSLRPALRVLLRERGATPGARPRAGDSLDRRMRRLFAEAGPVNLQLSGGEPCVRDDLPEIAALARDDRASRSSRSTRTACVWRATRRSLRRLEDAGVATVFLQFDGTRDDIHRRMRGRPLLEHKVAAIENCGEAGLGVVLVPVVVPGVNADNLGDYPAFRRAPTSPSCAASISSR